MDELKELGEVLTAFESEVGKVHAAGDAILQALRDGHKIMACGNGGSAADAFHLAQELSGRYRSNRRPLAGLCLSADPTAITCIGNDFGFEYIFSRQVEALGKTGDILVAFSTSGNSPNVLEALKCAKPLGVTRVLVSGKDGGICKNEADHVIIVPSQSTARIQEIHTVVLHHWLERVEAETGVAL
ncbi:MAG: SIS domain-containing protein [Opitutales bacterium]